MVKCIVDACGNCRGKEAKEMKIILHELPSDHHFPKHFQKETNASTTLTKCCVDDYLTKFQKSFVGYIHSWYTVTPVSFFSRQTALYDFISSCQKV